MNILHERKREGKSRKSGRGRVKKRENNNDGKVMEEEEQRRQKRKAPK